MSASSGLSATAEAVVEVPDDARHLEPEWEEPVGVAAQCLGLVSLPTLCLQRLT